MLNLGMDVGYDHAKLVASHEQLMEPISEISSPRSSPPSLPSPQILWLHKTLTKAQASTPSLANKAPLSIPLALSVLTFDRNTGTIPSSHTANQSKRW